MNRAEFSYKLFLLDNTSHMDRIVNGTPLLSFFRLNKPPSGQILIAYSDQYGNPKCEPLSNQLIQNIVTSPLGDYKSICRYGLTELAKKRFTFVEEYGKKSEFRLTNDGRGLQPLIQDSNTIFFCSDFYSFSPKFFKLARVGALSSEYLIRPIDTVFCLCVEEYPGYVAKVMADFPPWVVPQMLYNSNPYQLEYGFILRLFQREKFFTMRFVFPDNSASFVQIHLQGSKDAWPLPCDTCIPKLNNRDSPIPTYYLFPTIKNRIYSIPNQYKINILQNENPFTTANEMVFTVHTAPAGSPPFAILENPGNSNWILNVLPWDFPFLEKKNNMPDIIEYLKNVPLAYFYLTQQYLLSYKFDVSKVESNQNYDAYLKERREIFNTFDKTELHSTDLHNTSLESIRYALKNSTASQYKTVNSYEIIENYDTADDQNWNSFNTLVFQKNIYNQMWKSESLVSIDRIRELMPSTKIKPENVFAEELPEAIEDAPKQQQQQNTQQIPIINKNDESFFKLDQLVMILRERDIVTLRSILESLKNDNFKEFMFAKSFLLKALDRFGLRGLLDPSFVDSLK